MNDIYARNFKLLLKIYPDLETIDEYRRMENGGGLMPLSLDVLRKNGQKTIIALSHYFKSPCGDMIPDPDMEIEINWEHKLVFVLAYQDSFGYQPVYTYSPSGARTGVFPRRQKECNKFLTRWLRNISQSGYEIVAREGVAK